MAFNYSPKIVTNSLALSIDAANTKSYRGSGTSWTNLTSNNITGTLVNGPTFNSGNGGAIVFDGSNDYVNLGVNSSCYSPTGFTIDAWVKLTSNAGANPILAIYNNSLGYTANEYIFGTTGGRLYGWVYDSINAAYRGRSVLTTSITSGVWCNLHMVYDGGITNSSVKLYFNGTQFDTTDFGNVATFTSIRNNSNPMFIGLTNSGLGGPLNGSMASLKYYTRALSAQEILQNYNAVKTRFGL
jgi:hypothetical protein